MSFTGVNSTNPTHSLLASRYNPQAINSFKSHREFQKKILEWNLSTKENRKCEDVLLCVPPLLEKK